MNNIQIWKKKKNSNRYVNDTELYVKTKSHIFFLEKPINMISFYIKSKTSF